MSWAWRRPVFVAGGLFSIGDTHAVQGHGEVSGTAMEMPMRIVYEISVIKGGRSIPKPQYETDEYYATTGFATTIDEAARTATRYMIDYLVETTGLSREQAYMLCPLAGELKIAEAVDMPHMLVTMHMPKHIFVEARPKGGCLKNRGLTHPVRLCGNSRRQPPGAHA